MWERGALSHNFEWISWLAWWERLCPTFTTAAALAMVSISPPAIQVEFSMDAANRRVFGELTASVGVVAIVLSVAAIGFLLYNRCKRIQAVRYRCITHVAFAWWAELVLRTVLLAACLLVLLW
jgi:hypothetical protein